MVSNEGEKLVCLALLPQDVFILRLFPSPLAANETAIGTFVPPEGGAQVIDPRMRRSTEFASWVDKNLELLKSSKKVAAFCTAGVRCERASAYLKEKGVPEVYQLDGGIHRFLDYYPDDGGEGLWPSYNYVFDKRFGHGCKQAKVVSKCSGCGEPWHRYQAGAKCSQCHMETLLCKECHKNDVQKKKWILCWLCEEIKNKPASAADKSAAMAAARAFKASGGGRDGEGEGKAAEEHEGDGGGGGKGRFGGGGGAGGGAGGGFRR
jgi:predicted sulfurtransferase